MRIALPTQLTLDGVKYSLPLNDGTNSSSWRPRGFNNAVWKAKSIADGVELTYLSKDGEADIRATYQQWFSTHW